ncbi:MAG: Rdx family protein [Thermomicrobiales bacterium]|nr:Rdx family protein [Thermomicrobiales bacterium]
MAEKVLDKHSDKVSDLTLTPSSGGVFEVMLGDDLIYSKKATGHFPDPEEILNKVNAG